MTAVRDGHTFDDADVHDDDEAREDSPPSSRPPFFDAVYEVVARIPHGRVTTYGTIARALGSSAGGRTVGWAMHTAPEEAGLPCHRTVDR